jgi:hypothetical protein
MGDHKCPYCGSEIGSRKAKRLLLLQHKLQSLYGKRPKYMYDTSTRGRTKSDELSIEISDLLGEMTRYSRKARAFEIVAEE